MEVLWRYAGRRVQASSGGWGRAAEAGEGFSAAVQAQERAGSLSGRQTSAVTVSSGSEGEIFLGEEAAFTPFVLGGRLIGADLQRRRTGVSLVARPHIEENGDVRLALVPRFSRADGKGTVTLEEASTVVRARPGKPILIGGLDGHLFGGSSREGASSSLMVLTVRVGGQP